MQVSTFVTKRFSLLLPTAFQQNFSSTSNLIFNSAAACVRVLIPLIGTGAVITAILSFQQFLIQVYASRWQMALLFALIGLMVALLLGQYRLEHTVKTAKVVVHGAMLSSLIVTLLGIGVVICILNTAPLLA